VLPIVVTAPGAERVVGVQLMLPELAIVVVRAPVDLASMPGVKKQPFSNTNESKTPMLLKN
jgi:hypothetical protein